MVGSSGWVATLLPGSSLEIVIAHVSGPRAILGSETLLFSGQMITCLPSSKMKLSDSTDPLRYSRPLLKANCNRASGSPG